MTFIIYKYIYPNICRACFNILSLTTDNETSEEKEKAHASTKRIQNDHESIFIDMIPRLLARKANSEKIQSESGDAIIEFIVF